MKNYMHIEHRDEVSTQNTTVSLCANKDSEKVITQCTTADRVENVKSKTTATLRACLAVRVSERFFIIF